MALNENLHIIAGTLGQAPELRYASSGTAICNVSVASNYWDSNKKEEVTEWLRCVIIGRQAEYIGNHAQKGDQIMCKGRVQTRKWQDKDGQDRYTTETVCFDAQLPRGQKQQQAPSSNGYEQAKGRPAKQASTGTGFDDMDDDFPPF